MLMSSVCVRVGVQLNVHTWTLSGGVHSGVHVSPTYVADADWSTGDVMHWVAASDWWKLTSLRKAKCEWSIVTSLKKEQCDWWTDSTQPVTSLAAVS